MSNAQTSRHLPARKRLREWLSLGLIRGILMLPFGLRSRVAGWIGRVVLGRLSLRKRMAAAIGFYRPDLSTETIQQIAKEAPANLARLIVEVLSPSELAELAAQTPIDGPGLGALDQAHANGQAVILVSAHFGNYDIWRLGLIARGFHVGGYYKELGNPDLNARYVQAVNASGQPMFPDTREGQRLMIRHMRQNGMLGILCDLDRENGALVDFFGKPTRTVLSMAELALKYNALLVPIYAVRTSSRPSFQIHVDAPITPSDPLTMTQAINDSFEAQVRAHPEQWVWWHNRRK